MSDFRKHLEKRLEDADFRKEYEALEPECAAILQWLFLQYLDEFLVHI